jgi:ATP-dependent protease ClpP protease subunit
MEYNLTIRGAIGGWFGIQPNDINDYLNKHKGEQVDIAICSPGGYVDAGVEIYQSFKDHGDVHAHIIGMTASAATIIAMGAKTVDMVKNSIILIHNASTLVDEFASVNKEQLDQIINKCKKERNDLNTIDDLIASIYADKCKKSLDACKKKMTDGKWLSSQEAKDFGLIDEIREGDEKADKVLNQIRIQYSNSIIKDFGLPAIPVEQIVPATVADENGNPTESFMQKTWQTLKDRFINNHANKMNSMKKTFKNVCAILGFDTLESKDDYISLKVDDVQKVEDKLIELTKEATNNKTAKDAADAKVTDLQKQLDDANSKISDKEKEIANLKDSSTKPDTVSEDEPEMVDMDANRKLFNSVLGGN